MLRTEGETDSGPGPLWDSTMTSAPVPFRILERATSRRALTIAAAPDGGSLRPLASLHFRRQPCAGQIEISSRRLGNDLHPARDIFLLDLSKHGLRRRLAQFRQLRFDIIGLRFQEGHAFEVHESDG